MSGLRNDRLFPNTMKTQRARESVVRAQQTLQRMQRALQHPHSGTLQQVQSLSREYASAVRGTGGMLPQQSQLSRVGDFLEREAAGLQNSLTTQFLRLFGQAGNLVEAFLRTREGAMSFRPLKDQIQQAMQMLNQSAHAMVEREAAPVPTGGRLLLDSPTSPARPLSVQESSNRLRDPDSMARNSDSGLHRNLSILSDGTIQLVGPGFRRVYGATDYEITGEMVKVRSSNVFAIGLQLNLNNPVKSELIVRFKAHGKSNTGGATYAYTVHPDYFRDMLEAESRGGFVWSELRVRGTVAGHQVPVKLIRAEMRGGTGYLPRRAEVFGGVQRFVKRTRTALFSDGRSEVLTSPLPNQTLSRYQPTVHRPNVGRRDKAVDRGIPNRGTPDRGRPSR